MNYTLDHVQLPHRRKHVWRLCANDKRQTLFAEYANREKAMADAGAYGLKLTNGKESK